VWNTLHCCSCLLTLIQLPQITLVEAHTANRAAAAAAGMTPMLTLDPTSLMCTSNNSRMLPTKASAANLQTSTTGYKPAAQNTSSIITTAAHCS
jgi:hypothetical protein